MDRDHFWRESGGVFGARARTLLARKREQLWRESEGGFGASEGACLARERRRGKARAPSAAR
eukprot:5148966-Pleurochrysis_carterae.AAC.2